MTNIEIDDVLTGENSEALKAYKDLVAMQHNQDLLLKTGHEAIDNFLIGGLNNKMVFIGSRPSMGKTHHCQATINNLLDENINQGCKVRLLRMNLEMSTQALLLRELKNGLDKSMKSIISKPFLESEKEKVKELFVKFKDPRITNFSSSVEGEQLKYLLQKFIDIVELEDLEEQKKQTDFENIENDLGRPTPAVIIPKRKKVVLVDHLHIYSDKTSIDAVLKVCNEFKMRDPYLSFIFYFQFNRTTEDMWRESKEKKVNPRNMLPNSGHIYLTDLLMQYADLVMGMVIPQVADLEEFAAVYKDRNIHLKDHFIDDNPDNSFVRLKGRNRIFYNFIKIRMVDDFNDPRLYCSILDPSKEDEVNSMYENNNSTYTTVNSTPIFKTKKLIPMKEALEAELPPLPRSLNEFPESFGRGFLDEEEEESPF